MWKNDSRLMKYPDGIVGGFAGSYKKVVFCCVGGCAPTAGSATGLCLNNNLSGKGSTYSGACIKSNSAFAMRQDAHRVEVEFPYLGKIGEQAGYANDDVNECPGI